jgi:hypothetical protein
MNAMMEQLRLAVFGMVLACALHVPIAAAQTSGNDTAGEDLQLPVQSGDSLTNLFENDWRKVYTTNCNSLFKFGDPQEDGAMPILLIPGTVLTVPNDTYLTPRAQERIATLKAQRASLRDRLDAIGITGGEIGVSATTLENMLGSVEYATELDYITHGTALLEAVNQEYAKATAVEVQRQHTTELIVSGVAVLAISFAWLWAGTRRRKPARPTGDSRMLAALKVLDKQA